MQAEKFTIPEMVALRSELLNNGLDSWQAGELFQMFLIGRGYGVSPQAACDAATKVGGAGCTLESLQQELERIAMVM